MRFRDVGVQLETTVILKFIEKMEFPGMENRIIYFCIFIRSVVLCLISSRFMLSRHP